jgi:hypothetical protein
MSQNRPNEHFLPVVVDGSNQPVFVAANIEHGIFSRFEAQKSPTSLTFGLFLAYVRPSTIARLLLMPKRQDEYSVLGGFVAV